MVRIHIEEPNQTNKTETTMDIQEQIDREFQQALIETWCDAHGINPSIVTYKDGKLIIPVSF